MSRVRVTNMDILLPLSGMSDTPRLNQIAAVSAMAPSSALYKSDTTVQGVVILIGKDGTAFSGQVNTVAGTTALLASQTEVLNKMRATVDGDLIVLKGLVETRGTSDADAKAVGFKTYNRKTGVGPDDAPEGAELKIGTKGKYRIVVVDSLGRKHFAAQLSTNGGTTWVDSPGKGTQRKPTGYASGSLLSIRFAALYGQKMSNWSAIVTFTVP